MRRRIEAVVGLALAVLGGAACGPPAPDTVFLHTVEAGATTAVDPPTTLEEGDLVVVEATPQDGDEDMDLCVDTSVSGPDANAVRVARVRGSCRRYVVVAQAPGSATIRFEVRGTAAVLVLNVTPAR